MNFELAILASHRSADNLKKTNLKRYYLSLYIPQSESLVEMDMNKVEISCIDCAGSSSPRLTDKSISSIGSSVKVAPNPSSGNLNFSYMLPKDEEASILIINNLGQEVYSKLLSANSTAYTVDLASFNDGIYLYKIISEYELVGTGKFIIVK